MNYKSFVRKGLLIGASSVSFTGCSVKEQENEMFLGKAAYNAATKIVTNQALHKSFPSYSFSNLNQNKFSVSNSLMNLDNKYDRWSGWSYNNSFNFRNFALASGMGLVLSAITYKTLFSYEDEDTKMLNMLEESKKHIEKIKGNDVIFFLGSLGVGKSTAIAYLMGAQLWRGLDDQKGTICVKNLNPEGYPEIGGAKKSETFYPEVYQKDGYNFCDLPGFFHKSETEIEKQVVAITRELAIEAAKNRKFVIVVSYDQLRTTSDRGALFGKAISLLAKFFKNTEEVSQNVVWCINNVDKDLTIDDVLKTINGQNNPYSSKSIAERSIKEYGARILFCIKPVLDHILSNIKDEFPNICNGNFENITDTNKFIHTIFYKNLKELPASIYKQVEALKADEPEKLSPVQKELDLMLSFKKENTVIIDPVDKGESKKSILEKIKNTKSIPLDGLNFGWCFKYRAPNIVDNRNFFVY